MLFSEKQWKTGPHTPDMYLNIYLLKYSAEKIFD